nr:glycosyltransferase family 4 protein [Synechococcus sp. MU1642]
MEEGDPLRVLFIGRLDSYKRLDWLLKALAALRSPWRLSVVGDGPNRSRFEYLAQRLFFSQLRSDSKLVQFHGRLPEREKQAQISASDVLVLPSDRSNEAFGIVQLEAMAAGRIALAFDQPRSGMGWVGQLSGLPWSQSPEGLVEVLQRLADQPQLRNLMCLKARDRYTTLFARSVWLQQLTKFGDRLKTGMVRSWTE